MKRTTACLALIFTLLISSQVLALPILDSTETQNTFRVDVISQETGITSTVTTAFTYQYSHTVDSILRQEIDQYYDFSIDSVSGGVSLADGTFLDLNAEWQAYPEYFRIYGDVKSVTNPDGSGNVHTDFAFYFEYSELLQGAVIYDFGFRVVDLAVGSYPGAPEIENARDGISINHQIPYWEDYHPERFDVTSIVNAAPVPEPSTILLFGTGIIGLAGGAFSKKTIFEN